MFTFDEARAELAKRNCEFVNTVVKTASVQLEGDVAFARFVLAKGHGIKGIVYDKSNDNKDKIVIEDKLTFDMLKSECVNTMMLMPKVAMLMAVYGVDDMIAPVLLTGASLEIAIEFVPQGAVYTDLNGYTRSTPEIEDKFYYHIVGIELAEDAIQDFIFLLKA